MKSIKMGKEEVKMSLFTGDKIIYIENPKASTNYIVISARL